MKKIKKVDISEFIKNCTLLTFEEALRMQLGLSSKQVKRELNRFEISPSSPANSHPALIYLLQIYKEKNEN